MCISWLSRCVLLIFVALVIEPGSAYGIPEQDAMNCAGAFCNDILGYHVETCVKQSKFPGARALSRDYEFLLVNGEADLAIAPEDKRVHIYMRREKSQSTSRAETEVDTVDKLFIRVAPILEYYGLSTDVDSYHVTPKPGEAYDSHKSWEIHKWFSSDGIVHRGSFFSLRLEPRSGMVQTIIYLPPLPFVKASGFPKEACEFASHKDSVLDYWSGRKDLNSKGTAHFVLDDVRVVIAPEFNMLSASADNTDSRGRGLPRKGIAFYCWEMLVEIHRNDILHGRYWLWVRQDNGVCIGGSICTSP